MDRQIAAVGIAPRTSNLASLARSRLRLAAAVLAVVLAGPAHGGSFKPGFEPGLEPSLGLGLELGPKLDLEEGARGFHLFQESSTATLGQAVAATPNRAPTAWTFAQRADDSPVPGEGPETLDGEEVRLRGSWRSAKRSASHLGHDIADLATSPARMKKLHVRNLALGLALVGAAFTLDDKARVTNPSEGSLSLAREIRPLGRELGIGLLGATWLTAKATNRSGIQAATGDALEAVVLTGLATTLVKRAAGRSRPRTNEGSHRWGAGGESFVSGEVSNAFAIASVLAYHSDKWWGDALAWLYAGTISWERIQLDAHWLSDVAAGALIGHGIARWTSHRNQKRRELTWAVQPQLSTGGYGFSAAIQF